MKINKILLNYKIKNLEKDVDTHHREMVGEKSFSESKIILLNRLINILADLQLISPNLDIDIKSKEFRRIEVMDYLIKHMR